MEPTEGARTFQTSGASYDSFMGRYSRSLAAPFADAAGVTAGQRVLDVGCGPGALTTELVARLGTGGVCAVDPSPPFVADCSARHPGVEVRQGRAEALPFEDAVFDASMAQLVLHFTSDAPAAAAEMRRVVRAGGVVAACVWDFEHGMEMLRAYWDAALSVDPDAPDEARTLRFGRAGEIVELFAGAGLVDVVESTLSVSSSYAGFDELYAGFLAGIGPAGAHLTSLDDGRRAAVRAALFDRVGRPDGPIRMQALARCAVGRVPG